MRTSRDVICHHVEANRCERREPVGGFHLRHRVPCLLRIRGKTEPTSTALTNCDESVHTALLYANVVRLPSIIPACEGASRAFARASRERTCAMFVRVVQPTNAIASTVRVRVRNRRCASTHRCQRCWLESKFWPVLACSHRGLLEYSRVIFQCFPAHARMSFGSGPARARSGDG
jgi:hypothetical protein